MSKKFDYARTRIDPKYLIISSMHFLKRQSIWIELVEMKNN